MDIEKVRELIGNQIAKWRAEAAQIARRTPSVYAGEVNAAEERMSERHADELESLLASLTPPDVPSELPKVLGKSASIEQSQLDRSLWFIKEDGVDAFDGCDYLGHDGKWHWCAAEYWPTREAAEA